MFSLFTPTETSLSLPLGRQTKDRKGLAAVGRPITQACTYFRTFKRSRRHNNRSRSRACWLLPSRRPWIIYCCHNNRSGRSSFVWRKPGPITINHWICKFVGNFFFLLNEMNGGLVVAIDLFDSDSNLAIRDLIVGN